jgi:23S rRNA (cytidine1920-2'-O)/16S rRNA (cytidine1409-2'-O)-methyltransferase
MRLDQALQQRGLVASRSAAARLIQAGAVSVDGQSVSKAAFEVSEQSLIALAPSLETAFVSRAGAKLAGVFQARPALKPRGYWVDFGQSTGGFTDCLLQHGVVRVLGFDVGHDQLHPTLRHDPRVCCIEDYNLRYAWPAFRSPHNTAAAADPATLVDGVVIDVSFIALSYVMMQAIHCIRPGGWCIALIKPQFELGTDPALRKRWFKNGLVHEHDKLEGMLKALVSAFIPMGLHFDMQSDLLASVLPGQSGNQEYFLLSQRNPIAQGQQAVQDLKLKLSEDIQQARNAP